MSDPDLVYKDCDCTDAPCCAQRAHRDKRVMVLMACLSPVERLTANCVQFNVSFDASTRALTVENRVKTKCSEIFQCVSCAIPSFTR